MPQATGRADATRAVVFSPLEGAGRAELVEQRLTDAIVAGVLPTASACRASPSSREASASRSSPRARRSWPCATRGSCTRGADATAAASSRRPRRLERMIDERVRSLSRIELRDLGAPLRRDRRHGGRGRGRPGERRRPREPRRDRCRADLATAGRRPARGGRFQLEVAAISQSPRLVHEELRLQAEAAPCSGCACASRRIVTAVAGAARRDPGDPRRATRTRTRATTEHIAAAIEWLIDEKVRLEHPHRHESSTRHRGRATDRGRRRP